ncbi:amino acid ABC transporter permease [Aggregatilinea lenta]|uniref:amino acid ABC transporter permease n=1 Tax=Aggregatilinea lenta TaxID=913108 RepID=UPI000E5BEA2E|nr:amino acid ABC transporter permease [Aggregatilinea lenta]
MSVASSSAEVPRVNPQKRNILIRRVARAPWWLLALAMLIILFALSVQGKHPYPIVFRAVREGVWTTIWVSVVAYAVALVLGLIVALLRRSSNFIVYQMVTLYVEAVRGIPTLVLVYYMALALIPQVVSLGNDYGEWLAQQQLVLPLLGTISFHGMGTWMAEFQLREVNNAYRAIIGLSISYSAFLSEIYRAGIESVGEGQIEAAKSLGMNRRQVMRLIVLPQAFRTVLPPLGNDFIAMLKESSLVSVLGVQDITRRGQTYAASTFTFFQVYNVVALTYLVLTLSLSLVVKTMEWYLDRGKSREAG